jgi:hypothetical protein
MDKFTRIELLEIDLQAHERLLDTLTKKYIECLEDEGCPSPYKEYLKDRVNTLFSLWVESKTKLSNMPKVIDLTRGYQIISH